jgi:hypothetical protein
LAAYRGISLANVSPWIVQVRLISPFHPVFGRLHKKVGCIIGVSLMVFGRLKWAHHVPCPGVLTAPFFISPIFFLAHPSRPRRRDLHGGGARAQRDAVEGSSGASRHSGAVEGEHQRNTVEGGSVATRWRASASRNRGWRASSAGRGAGRARAAHQLPHRHARGIPPPSPRDPAAFFFEPLLLSPCRAVA